MSAVNVFIRAAKPAVTRVVEVSPATEEQITITMDRSTAEVLHLVVRCIGGDPYDTGRRHTDLIEKALKEAQISVYGGNDDDGADVLGRQRNIYFEA